MDQAKNFKGKNIILRITVFIIYFAVSGFAGVLCRIILDSFMRIVLRNNSELKDFILYLAGVCVIFAVLFFFSMREGDSDTQNLRYSVLKTVLCYFAAGIMFFGITVGADIYIFERGHFFKYHFFDMFYADEHFSGLTQNLPGGTGYLISAGLIFLNVISMIFAYKAGRAAWIARKKKQLKELRRKARGL
ncbi:MAG: hypothetical protein FWH24_04715 [Oscillospiraceae bacterium]|nr:hypothetical protein [Oscillospiraceae bacterium]